MLDSLDINIKYEADITFWTKDTENDPFNKRSEYVIIKLLEISPWFVKSVKQFREEHKIDKELVDIKELFDFKYALFEEKNIKNRKLLNLTVAAELQAYEMYENPQMIIARNYLFGGISTIIDILLTNNAYLFFNNMNTGITFIEGRNLVPNSNRVYIEISKNIDITSICKYLKNNEKDLSKRLNWHALPSKYRKLTFNDKDIKLLRYGFSKSKRKFVEADNDIELQSKSAKDQNDKFADKVESLKTLGLLHLFEEEINN
jgi:hypothetical protein